MLEQNIDLYILDTNNKEVDSFLDLKLKKLDLDYLLTKALPELKMTDHINKAFSQELKVRRPQKKGDNVISDSQSEENTNEWTNLGNKTIAVRRDLGIVINKKRVWKDICKQLKLVDRDSQTGSYDEEDDDKSSNKKESNQDIDNDKVSSGNENTSASSPKKDKQNQQKKDVSKNEAGEEQGEDKDDKQDNEDEESKQDKESKDDKQDKESKVDKQDKEDKESKVEEEKNNDKDESNAQMEDQEAQESVSNQDKQTDQSQKSEQKDKSQRPIQSQQSDESQEDNMNNLNQVIQNQQSTIKEVSKLTRTLNRLNRDLNDIKMTMNSVLRKQKQMERENVKRLQAQQCSQEVKSENVKTKLRSNKSQDTRKKSPEKSTPKKQDKLIDKVNEQKDKKEQNVNKKRTTYRDIQTNLGIKMTPKDMKKYHQKFIADRDTFVDLVKNIAKEDSDIKLRVPYADRYDREGKLQLTFLCQYAHFFNRDRIKKEDGCPFRVVYKSTDMKFDKYELEKAIDYHNHSIKSGIKDTTHQNDTTSDTKSDNSAANSLQKQKKKVDALGSGKSSIKTALKKRKLHDSEENYDPSKKRRKN